jgi:prophage antirepressor-like protein
MTKDLTIFNKEKFQVRTVIIDDEIWFIAKDVCDCLDLTNSRIAVSELNQKGVSSTYILTKGGQQSISIINEANLYTLIFKSRKPEAIKFQEWITGEVIPSIRKTGSYNINLTDPIELAKKLIESTQKYIDSETKRIELAKQIEVIEPPYNAFIDAKNNLTMNQVAKQIKGCGQNILFDFLRKQGILFSDKTKPNYNLPKQEYLNRKYFDVRTISINRTKVKENKVQTLVTPEGMVFIINLWNKKSNLLTK